MNRAGGYVVWVEFELHPAARPGFLDLVRENAARSVASEPGCRRFDVLISPGDGERMIALYEIYDDEAAFRAHCASAHFLEFDAASRSMVAAKKVMTFTLEENAK